MGKVTHVIASERAEGLFRVYYLMGPERSLDRLLAAVAQLGLKISRNTIHRYSVQYGWQARIEELDQRAREEADRRLASSAATMNEEQASLGRRMRMLADATLDHLTLAEGVRPGTLGAGDVRGLAETGTKIERLAMGEATERSEIVALVFNFVLPQIVVVFNEVNILPDAGERRQRFAELVDALIQSQVRVD